MSANRYLGVQIRTSPHFKKERSVPQIMRHVLYALIPSALFSVYLFGTGVLWIILTSLLSVQIAEWVSGKLSHTRPRLWDGSSLLTGLLLALTLPPSFPLWMVAIGSFAAIWIGKSLFGGLGSNVFNPALVGRAFLQAAFPTAITSWQAVMEPGRFAIFPSSNFLIPLAKLPDAVSSATPLALMKFEGVQSETSQLFWGITGGSVGETSSLLILIGGLYLAFRKFLDWKIPAGILLSTFIVSGAFYLSDQAAYPSPLFMMFSGGLMLGAFFMATDMVTSPLTVWGTWIYALLIGFLVAIIRLFGGLPEGVMYAILLGNGAVPLLNQWTKPRLYGLKPGYQKPEGK